MSILPELWKRVTSRGRDSKAPREKSRSEVLAQTGSINFEDIFRQDSVTSLAFFERTLPKIFEELLHSRRATDLAVLERDIVSMLNAIILSITSESSDAKIKDLKKGLEALRRKFEKPGQVREEIEELRGVLYQKYGIVITIPENLKVQK